MTTINSFQIAIDHIYSKLASDATLLAIPIGGVFRGIAPDGTATPYLVMAPMSGHDVYGPGSPRYMDDLLMQVYAIGPAASYANTRTAANQLDTLLEKSAGTVSSGIVIACRRQQPLALDELVGGVIWSRLGGLYRLWVSS